MRDQQFDSGQGEAGSNPVHDTKKEALAKSEITFEALMIESWETTRLKALELL